MAFRYEVRPLLAADTAESVLAAAIPAQRGMNQSLIPEGLVPWQRTFDTLRAVGTRTLLIQRGVLDPDFLEEHHAFYSRQHRAVPRTCVRVHAFAIDGPASSDPEEVLRFIDQAADRAAAEPLYLGFVTLRPLRHAPVGATILTAPPGKRAKAKDTFPVHIAGRYFRVSGTPFLQQDNAVGACAQASMWMALRTLRRRQGNAAYSPAELTVAATRYLSIDRVFPGRNGLTIHQMLEAVRFAGHDPLHLDTRTQPGSATTSPELVLRTAGPYIESGLPVIAALETPSGGHAVVAIGQEAATKQLRADPRVVRDGAGTGAPIAVHYEPAASWCGSLTVHNDNGGPYQILSPAVSAPGAHYTLEQVTSLIVPLPDGIYMTAAEAEVLAIRYLVRVAVMYSVATTKTPALPTLPFVLRAVLVTRHAFRQWAQTDTGMDAAVRLRYRTQELPAYLWLVEIHDAAQFSPAAPLTQSRRGEIVLDAAADPLHADGLIFATVSGLLWAASTHPLQGLLWIEDGTSAVGLGTAFSGPRIVRAW